MPKIDPGATLTPHFRDFLPSWIARQPWYRGSGKPDLTPVGFFRFEDPAGEVGIETHLVSDGSALYQIPMTYRGVPLGEEAGAAVTADAAQMAEQARVAGSAALIAEAEHSLLGRRWIYDAEADPVWAGELLRLVVTEGTAMRAGRAGIGDTEVRGRRLGSPQAEVTAGTIELMRVLSPGEPPPDPEPGLLGVVLGSWQPQGSGGATESGVLAVVRAASGHGP